MAKKKDYQAELKANAHKVWLAGLGALATAEEEGNKLFNSLVKKGKTYDADLKGGVEKATKRARQEAKKVKSQAEKAWEKIGCGFDDQVGAALGRIGVPSKNEIRDLTAKVDRLTRSLENLKGKKKPTRRKKVAKKKTAAKKATA